MLPLVPARNAQRLTPCALPVHAARMPTRRPTKAERNRKIALDLLADWRPYAQPLPDPRSAYDWRYFGTITMDGETDALAWRFGGYGFGVGASVRKLDLRYRIKVDAILLHDLAGIDQAPHFEPVQMWRVPVGQQV